MATKARQQYFADEASLSKEKREFSIADDIQQKIDSVETGAQVNKIETIKVNGTALIPDAYKAVNVEVPEVIDNLYTVDSDNALSAKQGKLLYDYIQNIASRGRFLSNWNSATGLPMTNPSESPYPYKSGDYFIVSNVAGLGGTNYRPDGSLYIIGQASTVVETDEVDVSDFYFYDGTNWLLLKNSGRSGAVDSSLSTTSTNPVENRVITNALNNKQNKLIAGANIQIDQSTNTISATGYSNLPAAEGGTDNTLVTTGDKYNWDNKQDGLQAGANIQINGNVISATNTTYGNLPEAQGGTSDTLVTTGDKYNWNHKQDGLTPGANIQINNNVISATDTKYTAGTGINIDANNEISSTVTPGQTYTAGNGINISQNNEISADTSVVATQTDLNTKQDTLTAGENTSIENICESDMQGPCPSGFHVPTVNEWNGLINIMKNALSLQYGPDWMQYLHMPLAGHRDCENHGDVDRQRIEGFYATSIFDDATPGFSGAYYLLVRMGDTVYVEEYGFPVAMGFSVRGFKNEYITPTSSWTVVQGTLGSAGIFRDQTNGLISITDGTTGYTMMDKNLGATTVWNTGDTLSEANCGKYYQWGNNYGFPRSGSIATSSTQVDASGYGPGNYYSSSTFITTSTSPFDWSSVENKNLRGGVSQGTWCRLTISAEDTKYTAGTGISIDANNVISNTQTSAEWGNITGTLSDQTDLQNALDDKQDELTAGEGISIDANNEISNTLPGAIVSATAPSNPTEGMVWYDTTEDSLKAYNGTSWETEGTEMVVLSYGHSTWQEFIDAYNKNAIVYCKASSNSNPGSGVQGRMAFMAFVSINSTTLLPTEVEFQYYRSRSDHNTAANQLDQVFVYKLTSASGGTWTVTERNTGAKAVAGTGISLGRGSGNMTISADTSVLATKTDLNSKQDTLVSGTNIKTVNSNSLLGSGDITLNDVKVSATAPASPTEGMVWYDTTNDVLKTYNGTSWDEAGGGGDVRVFAVPSVNDDISDMITRLSAGKGVILHEMVSGTDAFYKVDYHDDVNCEITASLLYSYNGGYARFYTIVYNYSTKKVSTKTSSLTYFFAPETAGTQGQVLTKTASGYEWQAPTGGIQVDSASPIQLTKIWAGTQAQYEALGSYDATTVYLTI